VTPDRLYEVLYKYAGSKGQLLNRDREFVLDIIKGLLRNEERYGYRSCPCRLASGIKDRDADIICPCVYKDPDIAEYGSCFCELYVSKEWNEGIIKHRPVPERRPPDKQV